MYTDILSSSNHISYNIKLAKYIGLHPAIYLAALLQLQPFHAHLPEFKLSRDYLTSLTTFNNTEQKSIENTLHKLGLIEVKDANNILSFNINEEAIINTIIEKDVKSLNGIKKVATTSSSTPSGKMSQRQKQFLDLKSKIQCNNIELLEAYKDWVDGVYANPKGFLSARAISVFQKTVDDFAKGDLDLALKIIDIATVNGYRDATWAINVFNKDYASSWRKQHHKPSSDSALKKVQVSKEVF